jgi:hypothetical protein
LGEVFPPTVKVFGFGDDFLLGEVLDLQEVDLALETGDLCLKLYLPILDRLVPGSEAAGGEVPGAVELEDLFSVSLEALRFPMEGLQEIGLGLHLPVGHFEGGGDLLGREEELLELLLKDPLQVHLGHLVPAGLADVLRSVAYVHPGPAVAEGETGEEVDRPAGRPGLALPLLRDQGIGRVPNLLGDYRLHIRGHPLMGGFQVPALAVAAGAGVVGAPGALGGRVADQALHGRMGELAAASRAVSPVGEDAGDREEPAVLYIQLVHEAADGRFLRVRYEPLLVPAVAEGSGASGGLAELGSHRDGCGDPARDLLALPGGHAGDHGVEEAAGRGRGVDGLLKRDEVGPFRLEEVREVEEFPSVPREPRELREDEARDAAGLHVLHHAARFRVGHDRFAGDTGQVVQGHYFPPADLGVGAGAVLVVLRALALGLVFGRDPDPDRDLL